MNTLQERLEHVRQELPAGVELVAVSKFHPAQAVANAFEAGQRIFGESHVQELRQKYDALPKEIEWHFIGHLQTNKVKYIAPFISLIHSVDSPALLREIDKQARRVGRRIPCLLELHVAAEESKFGFTPDACRALLREGEWKNMEGIEIAGLMCMATNTDDADRIRSDFHTARTLFDELKADYFADSPAFCQRSWGMSHDYPLAIEEGATLVRIGTAIFGERDYSQK